MTYGRRRAECGAPVVDSTETREHFIEKQAHPVADRGIVEVAHLELHADHADAEVVAQVLDLPDHRLRRDAQYETVVEPFSQGRRRFLDGRQAVPRLTDRCVKKVTCFG